MDNTAFSLLISPTVLIVSIVTLGVLNGYSLLRAIRSKWSTIFYMDMNYVLSLDNYNLSSLTLSLLSSSLGGWILFAPSYVGYNYSFTGAVCYSVGVLLSYLCIGLVYPHIRMYSRSNMNNNYQSSTNIVDNSNNNLHTMDNYNRYKHNTFNHSPHKNNINFMTSNSNIFITGNSIPSPNFIKNPSLSSDISHNLSVVPSNYMHNNYLGLGMTRMAEQKPLNISKTASIGIYMYVYERYGKLFYYIFVGCSTVVLSLLFSSELRWIAFTFYSADANYHPTITLMIIGVLTWTYSVIKGVQRFYILEILHVLLIITVMLYAFLCIVFKYDLQFSGSKFRIEDLIGGLNIIAAIVPTHFLNPVVWQRLGHSNNNSNAYTAIGITAVTMSFLSFFSGLIGYFARASFVTGTAAGSLTFLLTSLEGRSIFSIFMLILLLVSVSSSLDNLLNALTALFYTVTKPYSRQIPSRGLPFVLTFIVLIMSIFLNIWVPINGITYLLTSSYYAATIFFPLLLRLFGTPQIASIVGVITGLTTLFLFGYLATFQRYSLSYGFLLSTPLHLISSLFAFLSILFVPLITTIFTAFIEKFAFINNSTSTTFT